MAMRQIIQQLAVVISCGWFALGCASAEERITPPLTETEIESFGCLVGGAGLFTAGYAAGPSEAIMLWGGGLLVPSGSIVLAVSMLGGLGWAGCSIGATLAPTVAWFSAQTDRLYSYAAASVK